MTGPRTLAIEPLTKAGFALFGVVIERAGAEIRMINEGTTTRYHALSQVDVAAGGGMPILSIFAATPRPAPIAVSMMERHPAVIERALSDGHEIASHGWRWINYHGMAEDEERAQLQKAIDVHTSVCGERPLGWYTGRTSQNTRRIVAEEGGFLYDADDYSDDLPFWSTQTDTPHLIVPYTLDTNDMRFATAQGFHTGDQFATYLIDAFDTLYAEGETSPKMMSVGLHCRLIGRPARFAGLVRFLDHVQKHDRVWLARRIDIARHWREHHPHGIAL